MMDIKNILLRKAIIRILQAPKTLSTGYFKVHLADGSYYAVATSEQARAKFRLDVSESYCVFKVGESVYPDKLKITPIMGNDNIISCIDRFIMIVDSL